MKNWFAQLAGLAMVTVIGLTSCEKDEDKVTLAPAASPTLSASTNAVVLQQANSAQPAITFTWTPVAYNWGGSSTAAVPTVQYDAQIDKQGNNFARPVTIPLGTGTATSAAITVEALNGSLNTLGITTGVATDLEVRLRSYVAANSPSYSPTVALKATAYKVCLAPNADKWSIIGDAVEGWSTDVPLTYDCDTKTYNITRALKAGPFKFRKNNDWPGNLGDNGADKSLEPDGANIEVAADGTYTIALNLATSTYTLTKK